MTKICRLCLKCRKRMVAFYDKMGNITYAEMVASISNVKASEIDGLPEEICLGCCAKLKDIFAFRLLIERSDMELQKTNQIKRINFASIDDIKCKIVVTKDDTKDMILKNITEKFIKTNNGALNYNETVIRKISSLSQIRKQTLSVKEFLDSIKADPDNNYDIIYDVAVDFEPEYNKKVEDSFGDDVDFDTDDKIDNDSEDEYKPIKKPVKKRTMKKINNKENGSNPASRNNPIKPVFLADIRVARTKPEKKTENKVKSKKRPKLHICPYCGKMVTNLSTHCLTHTGERNFKCEICSKCFYSIQTLNYHKTCHSKSRYYKCNKCTAAFSRSDSLKLHTLVHTREKKFPCNICGKAFIRSHHLKRHLIGVHNSGARSFSCDQCSRTFVTKYDLRHHLRVHTGERPFKCEICSQPYSYKHDFNRHCLKKHGIFLKNRQVYVMNDDVLVRERALMKQLMLKVQGVVNDDKPLNPFEGPHAARAFEMAVKAIEERKIPLNI